jgi:hypothetical protein
VRGKVAVVGLALVACGSPQATGSATLRDAGAFDATSQEGDAESDAPDAPLLDGPSSGAAFGPDPSPQACDGGFQQCASPLPVCLDPRYALNYVSGHCVSGACEWTKYDLDCTRYPGGTCVGGSSDAGVEASADGGGRALFAGCGVSISLPTPPVVACDTDAGVDAAVCAPPRSFCASGSPGVDSSPPALLLYYDDGECVAGQCVWALRSLPCPSSCSSGACVDPVGTPAPPPPPNP